MVRFILTVINCKKHCITVRGARSDSDRGGVEVRVRSEDSIASYIVKAA